MEELQQAQTVEALPDPRWWLFKITDEQVTAIKQGDPKAIRNFFDDNEDMLSRIVSRRFVFSWIYQDNLFRHNTRADALAQIYVDLPLYNFRDSRSLYAGMFRSIRYCDCGGYRHKQYCVRYSLSLEAPFNGCDDYSLADILSDGQCMEDYLESLEADPVKFDELCHSIAFRLFPKSQTKRRQFLARI